MLLQEVNTIAMQRAAEFLVGPEVTAVMANLYRIIDQSMKDGYDLGKIDALRGAEQLSMAAFDNGYGIGRSEALYEVDAQSNVAYDNGYVDGVGDARARPELADDTIADIVAEAAQNAINGEFVIEVEVPSDGAIYAAVSEADAYRMRKGDIG